MIEKITLWMRFFLKWIRSQRECRKLKHQRDMLYDMVIDVYDDNHDLGELATADQMEVFDAVAQDIDIGNLDGHG